MALTLPKTWVDKEILTHTELNAQFVTIQSFVNSYCLLSTDTSTTNTASKIVKRDANGDFAARIITAVGATDTAGFVGDLEGTADKATNLEGGGSSRIPYQTATDTTGFVEAGTSGYLFESKGAGSSPGWINATNSNLVNTVVKRNNSGDFSANTITADLVGNVTGDLTGDVTGNIIGNVTGDVNGKSLTTDALTSSAITSQFQSSLGVNGYTYLPNGLIFQWGTGTSNNTITFPVTFPNACLNATAVMGVSTNKYENIFCVALTVANFYLGLYDSSLTCHWFAIGY
jgi:hypothetical protein